jgi:hypothetical protein
MFGFSLLQIVLSVRDYIAHRQWVSVTLIGLLAFGGSAAIGLIVGIPEPEVTDEFSYLLAADTFAHGRLTNPTHPMWIHFENYHIIQQPSYMSKYPPAQGLVLAVGQVIAGQPILGVWLSFALMCAAIHWMLRVWMPPHWAVLGSILALINPKLGISGYWAQSYWGGAIAATGGALLFGGLRLLMRNPRVKHALLFALGLSILANSRPYEGLLLSFPAGFFLLFWILSKHRPTHRISIRRIVVPIILVLTATVSLMTLYNFRVTGNPFHMPYQVHEETYAMHPIFLWQTPRPEPVYRHEDLRHFYTNYNLSLYHLEHTATGFFVKTFLLFRVFAIHFFNVFAIPIIATFALLSRWTWRNRWARFALIVYVAFISGELLPVVWAAHYMAPIAGLNYFFIVSSMRLWQWRDRKVGRIILWLIPLLALIVMMVSLCKTMHQDRSLAWNVQRTKVIDKLKQVEGQHAIIVNYSPTDVIHPPWEYNGADIDGAKVIWVRSMDRDLNCRLMEYFKNHHIWSLEIHGDQAKPTLKLDPVSTCK